ncbi:MAG: hypothetical protein V1929_09905 [bacterium]
MSDKQQFYNYAVGFVDLLGQKDEYRDQNLLPTFKTPEDEQAFIQKVRQTIGAILDLQKSSNQFLVAARDCKSPLRQLLPEELRKTYDEMCVTILQTQNWSDGIVYFTSLGSDAVKVPMNGIFNMITALGSLCFLGLAKKRPMRGGLEIAWGTELAPGELYGCAVVKAYEIESRISQYPRIVIGPYFLHYLQAQSQNTETGHHAELNRKLADICLCMLMQDVDGHPTIHYLGETYEKYISTTQHQHIYDKALEFIHASLDRFRSEKNTKLSLRYIQLLNYFEAHNPRTEGAVQPAASPVPHYTA